MKPVLPPASIVEGFQELRPGFSRLCPNWEDPKQQAWNSLVRDIWFFAKHAGDFHSTSYDTRLLNAYRYLENPQRFLFKS